MKLSLPIDPLLPQALEAIEKGNTLIVQASPGSGKTTRIAPYLLRHSNLLSNSQVWVLQPRRLAAKFAAVRVAEEENEKVGDWVGYHFRFERNYSQNTRLLFLTEGMLMRRLLQNPTLSGVSLVILDEFHERHLHTDLSLSFLKTLQLTDRPDLKLIVMSATLELDSLKNFLPEAPILKLESPLYPIETYYLGASELSYPLSRRVKNKVESYFSQSPKGDCLVFLPGLREIREAESEISAISKKFNFNVFSLHGDFDKEDQEKALAPSPKRKLVLSTNLAETSLTIPGVNCVIDSGLQRTASYSWWTGIPLLSTKQNSKASAIQRAGRAGRTGPGFCYRLYSQHDFETKAPFDVPEIRKADLAQTVLELKALGIKILTHFHWFEPPSRDSLLSAHKLLYLLGALSSTEEQSQLTETGKKMAGFGAHPRISRFLLECTKYDCLDEGIKMAALISENKLDSLDAIEHLDRHLDLGTRRVMTHLEGLIQKETNTTMTSTLSREEAIAISLLTAFTDRVAQAKADNASQKSSTSACREFVLSSGGTATLRQGMLYPYRVQEPYVLALSLQEIDRGRSSIVHLNSLIPIKTDWLYELNPCPLEERENTQWNREKSRIESASQLTLGQLIIENTDRETSNEDLVFEIILRDVFKIDAKTIDQLTIQDWLSLFKIIFPSGEAETELAKIQLWQSYVNNNSEAITADSLSRFFRGWLRGKRTLREISSFEFLSSLRQYYCHENEFKLEQNCPTSFVFPNLRKANIHYVWDQNPWIESKIQDFFGLHDTPRICAGKVALTAHLLAPNFRAVQVTSDLKNFWKTHYPNIKKELSRNYPRHPWPENPYQPLPPRPSKKV